MEYVGYNDINDPNEFISIKHIYVRLENKKMNENIFCVSIFDVSWSGNDIKRKCNEMYIMRIVKRFQRIIVKAI